jgi:hypothetical protein
MSGRANEGAVALKARLPINPMAIASVVICCAVLFMSFSFVTTLEAVVGFHPRRIKFD